MASVTCSTFLLGKLGPEPHFLNTTASLGMFKEAKRLKQNLIRIPKVQKCRKYRRGSCPVGCLANIAVCMYALCLLGRKTNLLFLAGIVCAGNVATEGPASLNTSLTL